MRDSGKLKDLVWPALVSDTASGTLRYTILSLCVGFLNRGSYMYMYSPKQLSAFCLVCSAPTFVPCI